MALSPSIFDPRPQRLMGERFTLLKTLGNGAFGEALLVIDTSTRRHMVVKRVFQRRIRRQEDMDQCLSEIRNIQAIRHVNIVGFHMAWMEASDNQLHMLFEYCDGGDLEHYLSKHFPLPESLLVQFFAQLLIAVDHLHTKHCIHRDIKLANVLLCRSPTILKLADFGLSKELSTTDAPAQTCLGTPLYFSPEIAAMKEYTRKTDIWSLGILCYQLLTRQFPFMGRSMTEVVDRIKNHQPPAPSTVSPQYHPELSRLVMKMLTKSRSARPTARELLSTSPLFADVLRTWPWQPQWSGCTCMFVSRDNCFVNVRAEPNTQSEILAVLNYGDQIMVQRAVSGPEDTVWHQIVYPKVGYCISAQLGKSLFQNVDDVRRASPFPLTATPRASPSPLRRASHSPVRSASGAPCAVARKEVSPTPRAASPLPTLATPRPSSGVSSPLRRGASPTKALPTQYTPGRYDAVVVGAYAAASRAPSGARPLSPVHYPPHQPQCPAGTKPPVSPRRCSPLRRDG